MESVPPVILVIDDDLSTREVVGSILRPRYEVLQAAGVREGLRHIESGRVDLVLLDVMMPETDGYEGCRQMKDQATARDEYIPILLLTVLNTQADRNRGLEAGADDFLSKPINRVELHLRVQAFVRLRWHERLLRHQIQALRSADALKDDLVALLIHDLRNPLCGITSLLEAMSESTIDETWRVDVDLAVTAGAELKDILEDLLHVKRFESGTFELRRALVDVSQVVADAATSMRSTARVRCVQIVSAPDPTGPTVSADNKLLRRAVQNLLSNAIRYSPMSGEVLVSVKHTAQAVEIEVADRGPGVPELFKKELFKKFGSVEAAAGGIRRGFGLGLYMVELAAKAHGGSATVRDREGGGTIFGIVVPADASRHATNDLVSDAPAASRAG